MPVRRFLRLLWLCAAALLAASLAGQFLIHVLERDEFEPHLMLLDVDAEANLPTWFAVATLLLCALQLAAIAANSQRGNQIDRWTRHWRWLSVIFVALSIDELAQLHEMLAFLQQAWNTHGVLYFAWVLPAGAAVLMVGLAYLRFLLALPAPTRWGFVAAGSLYLGGALGVEAISGWHAEAHGFNNFRHSLIATLEEALEMAGLIVFLRALFRHAGTEEKCAAQ